MPKSKAEIMTMPSHLRKRELKKRRNFRRSEAKMKLKERLKEEKKKK